MPTYEYECKKCFHRIELLQSIRERPKKRCPKCNNLSLERLISSGAGLIFKGSGFYITDYCRPQKKNEEKTQVSRGDSAKSLPPQQDKKQVNSKKTTPDSPKKVGESKERRKI